MNALLPQVLLGFWVDLVLTSFGLYIEEKERKSDEEEN